MNSELFFDTSDYAHAKLFPPQEPVWSALHGLKAYIDDFVFDEALLASIAGGEPLPHSLVLHDSRLIAAASCTIAVGDVCRGGLEISRDGHRLAGASLLMAGAIILGRRLALGPGCLIEGGATIKEPAIIGGCSEIRQGAYMRGYCLIGERCVVGHATEIKHSVMMDDAKAGHFAYLGDSILGNGTNLGAGTKCANLKFTPGNVSFIHDGSLYDTGLRKFGAILGDGAQTGCNSVTNPGTIIGRRGILMPNTTAAPGRYADRQRLR